MPAVTFHEFPDRQAASAAAAGRIARALKSQLGTDRSASLVVSGGSTPVDCLRLLSGVSLDWARVTVLPTDERWVPPDHEDSNEGMVRRELMSNEAGAARWLSFWRTGTDHETATGAIGDDLRALPRPFGAVLLGMGEDGHFASLFPDYDGLAAALDPASDQECVPVRTAGSPHPRLSLSLSALLDTSELLLLIFGAAKRRVFDSALNGDMRFPVAALLRQAQTPITTLWAP